MDLDVDVTDHSALVRHVLEALDLHPRELAELLGVSRETAERYLADPSTIPESAQSLLAQDLLIHARVEHDAAAAEDAQALALALRLEHQLRDVDAALARAKLERDLRALDRLLLDTYVGVGPRGDRTTKSELLSTYGSGMLVLDALDTSDLDLQLFGVTGIIRGRSAAAGRARGHPFQGRFAYSHVWLRRGEGWRLASSQMTPLHEKSAHSLTASVERQKTILTVPGDLQVVIV